MENREFPFVPGLSLLQARDTFVKLQAQYKDQISDSERIENCLGVNYTFPKYTGKR